MQYLQKTFSLFPEGNNILVSKLLLNQLKYQTNIYQIIIEYYTLCHVYVHVDMSYIYSFSQAFPVDLKFMLWFEGTLTS